MWSDLEIRIKLIIPRTKGIPILSTAKVLPNVKCDDHVFVAPAAPPTLVGHLNVGTFIKEG